MAKARQMFERGALLPVFRLRYLPPLGLHHRSGCEDPNSFRRAAGSCPPGRDDARRANLRPAGSTARCGRPGWSRAPAARVALVTLLPRLLRRRRRAVYISPRSTTTRRRRPRGCAPVGGHRRCGRPRKGPALRLVADVRAFVIAHQAGVHQDGASRPRSTARTPPGPFQRERRAAGGSPCSRSRS